MKFCGFPDRSGLLRAAEESSFFRQSGNLSTTAVVDSCCPRQARRSGDKDQGIERNGRVNFVPSDANAIAFRRTPQEVLRIAYLTGKEGVKSGGFYPKGMNGMIRST